MQRNDYLGFQLYQHPFAAMPVVLLTLFGLAWVDTDTSPNAFNAASKSPARYSFWPRECAVEIRDIDSWLS